MLVQARREGLRLVRQHDHGLLAGELAAAWREPGGDGRLPWTLVVATALHDVVWRGEDATARLNPATGAPYDFTTLPPARKRTLVDSGTDRLAAVDPEVAALVRAHHEALATGEAVDPASPLAWLRFFDNLSLFVCLSPPGSLPEARPPWLRPSSLEPPRGPSLVARWRGPDEMVLSPFPFGSAPLALELPYRDLPGRSWPSPEALASDWRAAPGRVWRLLIRGPI